MGDSATILISPTLKDALHAVGVVSGDTLHGSQYSVGTVNNYRHEAQDVSDKGFL
jgi:hypothetical protein